jgi:site-specific DNA recombinase
VIPGAADVNSSNVSFPWNRLRAMRENARQGFWNGARPPFGYRTADAEKRGQKVKKVLTVDEAEAAVVRDIFDLAFGRAGMPSGVKAIVNHLNGSARQHRGKAFHLSSVHRIPTATTYTGVHHFNRTEARTGLDKPLDEWIAVAVPPIIEIEDGASEPSCAPPETGAATHRR